MFYKCMGHGSPTVVMDAGLSDTSSTWDPLVHEIAQLTSVFVYDRAGLGNSEASRQPRTSSHMVSELHRLLSETQVKPPYVLVGHSFGGLNMMLFASRFPDEAAGLVLIDTPHPMWIDRLEEVLSPKQLQIFKAGTLNNREGVSYRRRKLSGQQVQKGSALPDVPLVALFAGFEWRPTKWLEGWPTEALDKALNELQTAIASSTPRGRLVLAQRSGNYIHYHYPQLLVDTIREVIEGPEKLEKQKRLGRGEGRRKETMYHNSAACPCCGQIDAVRKVSGVVSEGTTQTQQLGVAHNLMGSDFYVVGMQGSLVTRLAQRLAPPVARPGGIGLRTFLAAVAFFIGSTLACGLSLFTVTPEFGRFACGNWVLGIALLAAMLVVWPLSGIPALRRKQAYYDRMMEQASARFSQLYYCSRDDITFCPDRNLVIPVHELSAYLYTPEGA